MVAALRACEGLSDSYQKGEGRQRSARNEFILPPGALRLTRSDKPARAHACLQTLLTDPLLSVGVREQGRALHCTITITHSGLVV